MSEVAQRTRNIRLDPQKIAFLNYYTKPDSPTFSNAFQSALRAGFSESYSRNILGEQNEWISDNLVQYEIVNQAEQNLKEFLSPEETDKKIKADLTKFALERLKKHKYSTRQEHTGQDGEPLFLPSTLLGKNELDRPVVEAEIVEPEPPTT
jgi:hypothetical protein